jgi:hypothetical protein
MSMSGRPAGAAASGTPTTSFHATQPSGTSPRTTIVVTSGSEAKCGARRSIRSSSATSSFVPESCSPYSSSGPVHHAFSGTTIAPVAAAPKKAMGHSGKLRIAMATRSPFSTPKSSTSARAKAAAAA